MNLCDKIYVTQKDLMLNNKFRGCTNRSGVYVTVDSSNIFQLPA